jgi:hypothetical protein
MFGDIAEEWFKSKLDRRSSHEFDLRTRLEKQTLPAFEKEKLDRITVAAIEKFRDKLRTEKYAHRTINRFFGSSAQFFGSRSSAASTRRIQSTASSARFSQRENSILMRRRSDSAQTRSIPIAF